MNKKMDGWEGKWISKREDRWMDGTVNESIGGG